MILNFAQEFYYLENKVGVVDFTKAHRYQIEPNTYLEHFYGCIYRPLALLIHRYAQLLNEVTLTLVFVLDPILISIYRDRIQSVVTFSTGMK